MGVLVVRASIRLRARLPFSKGLANQLAELEVKYKQHDKAIVAILETIRRLMQTPDHKRRGIGFTADLD
jgi:hypothetical protein